MPISRVKPANSSEITQHGTCGTALSLAQCTGGQGRLRLEKRSRWGAEDTRAGHSRVIYHSPQVGPAMPPHPPLGKKNPTSSHVLQVGMEVFLNMASVS